MSAPLLEVRDIRKYFPLSHRDETGARAVVRAFDGISFEVARGETLSLVGESGCGKSSVGRAILRLYDVTAGEVLLDGQRIDKLKGAALKRFRRRVQVIFQDPFAALNPRQRVRDVLAEPIRNFGLADSSQALEKRIADLLRMVGLPPEAAGRWPHEFSGGQRQRICIARALAAEPEIIVCDEAVSALDVSVKAQIVNLLQDLQKQLGLAMLFISHDLAVVEHMTHRVAVMYLGQIVEIAQRREIFGAAKHPYTQALLSAVPLPQPGARAHRTVLKGDVPSPVKPPTGCRFHTRCPKAFDRCRVEVPVLKQVAPGQFASCHLYDEPVGGQPHA